MTRSSRDLGDPSVDDRTVEAWSRHVGLPRVDSTEVRTSLSAGSLPEELASVAARAGSRPALSVGGSTVSHEELSRRAGDAAAGLSMLGVTEGSRVLLIAAVGAEEIVAYLAILRLGATTVLANPSLTSTEIEAMRRDSGAEHLIGSGTPLEHAAQSGAWKEVLGLRKSDVGTTSVVLRSLGRAPLPIREVNPDSTAVLAFTSGTTGSPKATPLSHRNLLSSIRGVMSAWRWKQSDHLVHSLPISHQHGLSGIHATLLAGSRATLLGAFDGETTFQVVVQDAASVHFGVPAIYQRLLSTFGERCVELARLRLAVSGSGPLPVELARTYESQVGAELLERYGTTESGLDVSNLYDGPRCRGFVGLPLPGIEVAIATNSGDVLPDGEVGQVLVRGPQVFSGYEGLGASEQTFVGDWFVTGDLGRVDEGTGWLEIVGRSKDLIITGGMNVYPSEVEQVLLQQTGVMDVAVVGIASQTWGEEVVAIVAPRSVDTRILVQAADSRLAPYKRPKRYVTVDEIPRSSVGKISRDRLEALVPLIG